MAAVAGVHRTSGHTFSKPSELSIRLIEGRGVEGDAHFGATVKHRWHVARDPSQPNLRQVHLMHAELLGELTAAGFNVGPGDLGENITTRGVDLLALPAGTRLKLGSSAVIELTGLRAPCMQLDRFQRGLKAAMLDTDANGNAVPRSGVMAIVVSGGDVRAGDEIAVELPAQPHRALAPV